MPTVSDLRKLVPVALGPDTHGKDFIKLHCYCDFEGHGRATEDWEEHWRLELPLIPFHWLSTKGWKRGNSDLGMLFHGKTHQQVIDAAVDFMTWWREHAF